MQLDLFKASAPPPHRIDWQERDRQQRAAWEPRMLADMADAPLVCCYPGFTGAVCEGLMERGLASKEPAGFMMPLPGSPPKLVKTWRKEDFPQFRYTITDDGRAILQAEAA